MRKNSKIDKSCLYCEHAYIRHAQELSITCRYKAKPSPQSCCLHFRYDPLKRTPKPKRPLPTLDPSCIID